MILLIPHECIVHMKAMRVTPGEELPGRVDRHSAIHERGCSVAPRDADVECPKRPDAEEIARRYRAGYSGTSALDDELEGWAAEGTGPEE